MTQMPLKDNLVEQVAHEIITISRWAGSRIKRHQATQGFWMEIYEGLLQTKWKWFCSE